MDIDILPLFSLGRCLITPGAQEALDDSGESFVPFLNRHVTGDWGTIDAEDAALNVEALAVGNRLLSVYQTSKQVPFWIITERDRSATTILLPSEY
jgi:hypothetical protein